jgi:hypothetical protein
MPQLSNISFPEYAPGDVTTISATIPTIGFTVPSVPGVEVESVTEDSLFGTIRNRLQSNILTGGTMLNPIVEADIWNRDLERNEQALQDAVDKVTGQWAKLGFSVPDGLLAGSLIAINNEYMNKRLDRSREIAVKQAELEQSGLMKSLELGVSFEQIVIASANEFMRRRLEAAKITSESMIEIFKGQVLLYNSTLEGFKTQAAIYETKIKTELARAEVYKARISGIAAIISVDEAKIKAYVAQVSGLDAVVNVYNTQMKGAALLLEAEKTKVDIFKSQIDAHNANIDGLVRGYVGQMEGFKGSVQAASAASAAANTNVESSARIAVAYYEAQIKLMEATARIAESQIQARVEATKGAAQAASNLAAGALSAIHASVQDSYSYQVQRTV